MPLFHQTDVFRKETSVNALLHATSSHPESTIKAVPIGQFLRMRRICSQEADFENRAKDLQERFTERGYSKRIVRKAYNRAKNSSHSDLIYRRQDRKSDDKAKT